MFDSPYDLCEKIRLGEDTSLELKEVRFSGDKVVGPHRDGLADELAAFANGCGGVCVLGVEDGSRQIVGIPVDRLDAVDRFVTSLCQDVIVPPLIVHTERLWLPSALGDMRAVFKVGVARSLFVHKSPGGYFHRVGSDKRQMAPDYLARLFQQRSQTRLIRFDEQLVTTATLDHLEPAGWQRFQTARTLDAPEIFLTKLAMAGPDETGVTRPTVAGVLLAATDPRRWLPNAYIQAVAYTGATVVPDDRSGRYQRDAKDIGGPIDHQVIEACRFVAANSRVAAAKTVGRKDSPQFDPAAVFEALVNAVAHRDYSLYGSKIRLRLFPDRLELFSPGALSNTMTVESLAYRQACRNEAVTSLLARCSIPDRGPGFEFSPFGRRTMMDKRGEGVAIILERSAALSGRLPEYKLIDDSELQLTIFSATED